MHESFKLTRPVAGPVRLIIVGLVLIIAAIIWKSVPDTSYNRTQPVRDAIQTARSINQTMFAYASDHGGVYPIGNSSTEVFQRLIDEKYVTDPGLFFQESLNIPGKIKATSNVLKPENVCWDVTIPVDATSPDALPLVFLTGYKVNYVPDGSAVPLFSTNGKRLPGIAVCYHGNNSAFIRSDGKSDGVVTNFIFQKFDPADKKYQQLTPDGPVAP